MYFLFPVLDVSMAKILGTFENSIELLFCVLYVC